MKKFICYCIFIITILVLFICSGCSDGAPSESDISNDLSNMTFENVTDDYSVKKVKINKAKVNEGSATYWCDVIFENACYEMTASTTIIYGYYQTGGWMIENVEKFEDKSYVAIAGYPEDKAMQYLDYVNYNVKQHNTDLEAGTDEIVYEIDDTGIMYDEKGTITITYYMDSSEGWVMDDKVKDISHTLHPQGVWNDSYGGLNKPICILSYNDEYVDIAEYCFWSNGYEINYYSYKIIAEDSESYYLCDDNDEPCYGFDKNGIERYDYNLNHTSSESEELYSIDEETLSEEKESNEFLYGFYDVNYQGDLTGAIVVPDVIGKSVNEAIKILHKEGFGEIDKYYDDPKTVKGIYLWDEVIEGIDITGEYLDKNSKLCIFNYDD